METAMRGLNFPEPIAAYFEADRRDSADVARCFTTDGVVVDVTSRVTGHFPGSPVDLRFIFTLERGKVGSLEITP
jgi:hypothetical protein